jgi:hypothetical protein
MFQRDFQWMESVAKCFVSLSENLCVPGGEDSPDLVQSLDLVIIHAIDLIASCRRISEQSRKDFQS